MNVENQFSRRTALLTIGGTVGIAAVPVAAIARIEHDSASRREWSRLVADYEKAKAAEDHYNETVWNPAYAADKAQEAAQGNPWPGVHLDDPNNTAAIRRYYARKEQSDWLEPTNLTPAISEESERLQELRCEAEEMLVNYPAPDAEGLALKVSIAFAYEREGYHYAETLAADARRLLSAQEA